jgi:hypothetical protein
MFENTGAFIAKLYAFIDRVLGEVLTGAAGFIPWLL